MKIFAWNIKKINARQFIHENISATPFDRFNKYGFLMNMHGQNLEEYDWSIFS